jgi:hypothetical protein
MTREQKKKADGLIKEIDLYADRIRRLDRINADLEKDNNPVQVICQGDREYFCGLKIETNSAWVYIESQSFGLTFTAIVKADFQKKMENLEAELKAL